jgi:aryl-alcohol dehydrogenase-like predicted oxidoreductase
MPAERRRVMTIERRRLGGIEIGNLVLGTSGFARTCDEPTARALVDRFLEAGGNCFDTADAYAQGEAEAILGRLLKGRRHEVVIASKVGGVMGTGPADQGLSRRHILASIDASLNRLQTDYLDLYQPHHWDPDTPLDETIEALDRCVRAGKVRAIGWSNLDGWQLGQAVGIVSTTTGWRVTSLQIQYSLLQRTGDIERLPACEAFGIGVLAWSPLAGGFLTGKYRAGEAAPPGSRGDRMTRSPTSITWTSRLNDRAYVIADLVREVAAAIGKTPSQVALRWVLDRPAMTGAIIGPNTVEQLVDNLGTSGWRLPAGLAARLDEASAIDLGVPYVSPRGMT